MQSFTSICRALENTKAWWILYFFIFRRIHFSYDLTCAKIHFSYKMGKLKLHFSYNSYIKISQTSLIDLFGIWILYVVSGFWLWVLVMGWVSKDKNRWHSGSEDNSRSIILTDNQQPTTNNRQPTISSTRWSVCLGMLSSACRKHRMRRWRWQRLMGQCPW